jgi:hypothetical protein
MFKKNISRLIRLHMRSEYERQSLYLAEGPYIIPDDAISI